LDSLLRKRPRNENNLLSTWKQAAERESRQRVWRFLLIAVALLGLLGGIVGEQLGLWSLRAVMDRAMEMVRQRVALVSGLRLLLRLGVGLTRNDSGTSRQTNFPPRDVWS